MTPINARFPAKTHPFPEPKPLANDYLPRPSRGLALIIGAASVADPWASFFEDERPWGERSPGFWGDRVALAGDARRAFSILSTHVHPNQERLFDPSEATDH
jgi:hypothetical protein